MSILIAILAILAVWLLLNVAVVAIRLRATAPPRRNKAPQLRRVA